MNFQQLEYIVAVDKYKNFTKAAESCYVTQATLSAMIKKLEEELDVVIFDRKSKKTITTDLGRLIIDEANGILQKLRNLNELLERQKGLVQGKIKIGVIPTIATSLLPIILRPILESYPDLELEVLELVSEQVIHQLKLGSLDMGIIATPWRDNDIEEEVLYYEALMVYGEESLETEYLLPNQLIDQKIWLLEEGHCLRDQFINYCSLKAKTNTPKNLVFEANSFETLIGMVDNFGGMTLIPELYYHSLSADKQKKVSQFKKPIPVREVSLVYYRPYVKHQILQALTQLIKDTLSSRLSTTHIPNKDLQIVDI